MTRAIIDGVRMAAFAVMVCISGMASTTVVAQTGNADPYFTPGANSNPANVPPPAAPLEAQFLNRRSFEMPVQLHDQQAREIRLYVSTNGGQQWQLYNRYRPDVEMVPFACRNDGEYWFALYTINQANAIFPTPSRFDPMLKLRVDTERPRLDAQAFPGQAGGMTVRWKADDPYLNPASLRIEYRPKMNAGRELPWQAVASPEPPADPGTVYQNSINAWPETNARVLEVKISIADWAGNITESVQELSLPLVAQPAAPGNFGGGTTAQVDSQVEAPEPESIRWGPSGSEGSPSPSGTVANSDRLNARPVSTPGATNLLPGANPSSSPNSGPDWSTTAPQRSFDGGRPEDAGRLPVRGSSVNELSTRSQADLTTRTEPSGNASPSLGGQTNAQPIGERVARRPSDQESIGGVEELPPPLTGSSPQATQQSRTITQREEAGHRTQAISLLPDTPGIPSGQVARLTNDTEFRLSYEVESVGRGGVAKVQLWMTEDAGQTWKLWTEDPDCESPIAVQTPGEGVYGYRLVVTARNGLAGETPQSGDLADMWVEIDRTAPKVEMLQMPTRDRIDESKLLIRWDAEDRNLGQRPVTLKYSESASGPWEILTAGLANTGQYDWRVVPSLPRQVYLRIEVRDRAGNVAHDQLAAPVDLSSLSPRGTLRGFQID